MYSRSQNSLTTGTTSAVLHGKDAKSFFKARAEDNIFFQPKRFTGLVDDVKERENDVVADYKITSRSDKVQRQPVGGGMSQPPIIPIITNREIVFPCPEAINSLVPKFIREAREHAVMILNGQQVMSPTQAQIALEAFRYLGKTRQKIPAEDPRNPTEEELSIASAEHYCYARHLVASGEMSPLEVRVLIDGYTLTKDILDSFGAEWILALPTDGGTPTRATRCQNDWGHQGVNDGIVDWATDHPQTER